ARSLIACCSSSRPKSIVSSPQKCRARVDAWLAVSRRVRSTAESAGQAETEHADQVTLDLVGAAAEGQDQEAAVVHLEATLEERARGLAVQVRTRSDDHHQQAERLEVEL